MISQLFLICILFFQIGQCWLVLPDFDNISALPPMQNMTFPQMMKFLNYPCETHYITTEDGYILTFFRIQSKNSTIKSGLPVVYFQHGLEDSSDTICLNDEDLSPGFTLANAGYDLWLGNSRGNRYSLNHTKYTTKDKKFWQFSFQDMGMYDVPAAFEYIAKQTQQKINYVGHSQGTIQMFVTLSRNIPVVKNNIKSYIALGPVAWVGNIESKILNTLANNLYVVDAVILSGIQQFFPFSNSTLTSYICEISTVVCGLILKDLMDMDIEFDNLKQLNVILGHLPAGTSLFNIRHWAQNIRSKEFTYFDYGKIMNLVKYGTTKPPKVAVENIDIPVHLFVGKTDELADIQDVDILRKNLVKSPNVTYNLYPFGHASFLIGKNMTYFNDVLDVLEFYNPKQTQQIQY